MITNLRRSLPPTLHQHITHLLLLKQLEDPHAQAVEMLREGADIDRFCVGLEGVRDAWGEAGRQVQRDEGCGGGAGYGEHFGQPEGEVDAGVCF
ncbi:hypothetical protein HYALB_00002458 [Hymenoscyphus albidus]|uniref:Uncharacterized protein n=1 Tax=Hymenoscyphus albidus TaxID=595503 RepID=A0A9N9Q8U1_9HELO|nr:hypothetical protein HYALB_00002458 [Hymenoscyphus albidus]